MATSDGPYVRWFDTLGSTDVGLVGGKNASLRKMIQTLGHQGIRVPQGFATTAAADLKFVNANELIDPLRSLLDDFARNATPLVD